MNRPWLKVLCVFWLVAVTPLFGLIPLWCIVAGGTRTRDLCGLERAFLPDIWLLFFPDTTHGFDDVGPPLTVTQGWTIISIVLVVTIVALYYCIKWWVAALLRKFRTAK